MQLHALDKEKNILSASMASKQVDYHCIECGGLLRLRGGFHRRSHFYHLAPTQACRQNGKTMEHLQTQCYLLDLIPPGEGAMEHPFPQSGRIADVVWFTKSLIFEVQCSPLSRQEVLGREKDYAALGFSVVWILHDREFNGWRLSAAENTLLACHHYFTNIDAQGGGVIYDQYEVVREGIRLHRFPPLSIQILHPQVPFPRRHFPFSFLSPRFSFPFYFQGDLLDTWLTLGSQAPYFQQVIPHLPQTPQRSSVFEIFLFRPYRMLFHLLLDRACR